MIIINITHERRKKKSAQDRAMPDEIARMKGSDYGELMGHERLYQRDFPRDRN